MGQFDHSGLKVCLSLISITKCWQNWVIDWIENKETKNTAVSKTELLHEYNEKFRQKITRRPVDSFVKHHADEFVETKSIPQENPRLEMPRALPEAPIEGF
jgi:hypothetical protein